MTFPAALAGVLFGTLATLALGFSIARLFLSAGGLTRREIAAWSFATGLLVQSAFFLLCMAVFRGPVRGPLLALDALVVAASFQIGRAHV